MRIKYSLLKASTDSIEELFKKKKKKKSRILQKGIPQRNTALGMIQSGRKRYEEYIAQNYHYIKKKRYM